MQVLTTVIVLGLCIGAFVYTDIKGYKERKIKSSVAIADVIGSTSISALQFLDNESAIKILANLEQVEPDIVNAVLMDNKGNVFARYTREGYKPYKFSFPQVDKGYNLTPEYLYITNTIRTEKETVGAICLQVELGQLEVIREQNFQIAIILLIVGIGLAFLIAILNQQYISQPILYLVNVMRRIRESENYQQHVEVKGKDEIGTLSNEFNNLMEEVVRSHQKKDEFIGVASHELKTPLTSIKAYLQLLEKVEKEMPNVMYVQKAHENVEKLQQLIFDLLDVSKIQAGQLQLNIKAFNLSELISQCIMDAQLSTTKHTIINRSKEEDQMIFADRNRIEQVVVNLLSNAIKYSPHGKEVIVNTVKEDSKIVISVHDNGLGIPKPDQKKIFERFYRAQERPFGISGFGLGLYICSEIIKRHRGKIWVESDASTGTTFYFSLPVNPRQ